MERQKAVRILSPYSLKWFNFCMYFRYPFTLLMLFIKILMAFEVLEEQPIMILDIFMFIPMMALFCIAHNGCLKFKKYGLYFLYATLTVNIMYSILIFLLSLGLENYLGATLTPIIASVIDIVYFYKRRSLFDDSFPSLPNTSLQEDISSDYNPQLASQDNNIINENEITKVAPVSDESNKTKDSPQAQKQNNNPTIKYCSNCKKPIPSSATHCIHCGRKQKQSTDKESSIIIPIIITLLLAFLIVGPLILAV